MYLTLLELAVSASVCLPSTLQHDSETHVVLSQYQPAPRRNPQYNPDDVDSSPFLYFDSPMNRAEMRSIYPPTRFAIIGRKCPKGYR